MKKITVKSARSGTEVTGAWNGRTYKSYYSDDCVRIYLDGTEVNVLKTDMEAIASEEMKKDEERKKAQEKLEKVEAFQKAIKIVLNKSYLNAYCEVCSDETSELLKEVFADFNAKLRENNLRGFLLEF